jgi:hypothetical protein
VWWVEKRKSLGAMSGGGVHENFNQCQHMYTAVERMKRIIASGILPNQVPV